MNLKFGLEKEFFVKTVDGAYVLASEHGLAYDECGYLCEARGAAFNDITDAVFALRAETFRLQEKAAQKNLVLDDTPVAELPRALLLEARRRHAKGVISYRNFRGHTQHRNTQRQQIAGVHLSVSYPVSIPQRDREGKDTTPQTVLQNFDWMALFWRLDQEFAAEIRAARRNPGFYELKSDGRVEYRSLPSNVDLDKVIRVVTAIRRDLEM